MTHFLDYLADRVVLCDGAMGTRVQASNLDVERDFLGLENCTEIVCESRPDLVRVGVPGQRPDVDLGRQRPQEQRVGR